MNEAERRKLNSEIEELKVNLDIEKQKLEDATETISILEKRNSRAENDVIRAKRKLDGYGKERSAAICIDEEGAVEVVVDGQWSTRDYTLVLRPFSQAIKLNNRKIRNEQEKARQQQKKIDRIENGEADAKETNETIKELTQGDKK